MSVLPWYLLQVASVSGSLYIYNVSNMNMDASSSVISTANVSSNLHCGLLCEVEYACVSYSFNSMNDINGCTLYNTKDPEFDLPDTGRKHFQVDVTEIGSNSEVKTQKPDSCDAVVSSGVYTLPGIYDITRDDVTKSVYCDGNWTVIQRRKQNESPFDLFKTNINQYAQGFGDPTGDFWIGNDILAMFTKKMEYELHIKVLMMSNTINPEVRETAFSIFAVGSRDDKYRLTIGNGTGIFADTMMKFNNMEFYVDGYGDPAPSPSGFCGGGGWWKYDGFTFQLPCLNCYDSDGTVSYGMLFGVLSSEMKIKKKSK